MHPSSAAKFILEKLLGQKAIKNVKEVEFTSDGIKYTKAGKTYLQKVDSWTPDISDFFLFHAYSSLLAKGYMCAPIPDGWVVSGGSEVYTMNKELTECTCGSMIWKKGLEGVEGLTGCKHILMVKAYKKHRRRERELRQKFT